MDRPASRRGFLKSAGAAGAAALTAASYSRVLGANERLRIALIGCGGRGIGAHMGGVAKVAKEQNAAVTAVVDPWRVARERAAMKAKEWFGVEARQCVSYRDVVGREDIDAVMIASCDHQHTTHLEAAARAKKDVYCEKPLSKDLPSLIRACDAVRASQVVCQIGTQLRSLPSMTGCRALFRTGVLGKVSRIERHRNATRPYWYSRLKKVEPKDVEWAEFLCGLPDRPFNAELFSGWYGYREFSDGPVPGLGSHFIDLVHYITGAKHPVSAVCHGGTFTWKDHGFTCPDHVEALWIYPEGFMVTYSTNFGNSSGNVERLYAEHGIMDLLPWGAPTVAGDGAIRKGKLGKAEPVKPVPHDDHVLDWLKCIRSRGTPNADIEAGYQHAVAVVMAMKAFDTGRRIRYDAEKRTFSEEPAGQAI